MGAGAGTALDGVMHLCPSQCLLWMQAGHMCKAFCRYRRGNQLGTYTRYEIPTVQDDRHVLL